MIEPQSGPAEARFRVIRDAAEGWMLEFRKTAEEYFQRIAGPFEHRDLAVDHAKALVAEAPKQTFLNEHADVVETPPPMALLPAPEDHDVAA